MRRSESWALSALAGGSAFRPLGMSRRRVHSWWAPTVPAPSLFSPFRKFRLGTFRQGAGSSLCSHIPFAGSVKDLLDRDPNSTLYQSAQRLAHKCGAWRLRLQYLVTPSRRGGSRGGRGTVGRTCAGRTERRNSGQDDKLNELLSTHYKEREKVVVLGTGWCSLYFTNQIDPRKFDITIVSPRPYFLYTPLLTSALSGTLSLRSLIEPIANRLFYGGKKAFDLVQASAVDVDVNANEVVCQDRDGKVFRLPYSRLVMAVGSVTNTFGIEGVAENCTYLKDVSDVKHIRRSVFDNFDKASRISRASPNGEAERKRLLSTVVVGGGPAGVEAAAEIQDLIRDDLSRAYPELVQDSSVTIVEMLPGLIPMFGKKISDFCVSTFEHSGINTLLRHRVNRITPDAVELVNTALETTKPPSDAKPAPSTGNTADAAECTPLVKVPYGLCVWASGVGQVDFAKKLLQNLPDQKGNRVLRVRPDLRLIGSSEIFALGDCAYVTPPLLADKADELYDRASQAPQGPSIAWLQANRKALIADNYVQLHPKVCSLHELTLDGPAPGGPAPTGEAAATGKPAPGPAAAVERRAKEEGSSPAQASPGGAPRGTASNPRNTAVRHNLQKQITLEKEEFKALLKKIDGCYRAPVATAQSARQAGSYLAARFNIDKSKSCPASTWSPFARNSLKSRYPFAPTTYGAMSYCGEGKAVVELTTSHHSPKPKSVTFMGGFAANAIWRGYYWVNQTSAYNRVVSAIDYARAALGHRDLTSV